MLVTDNSVPLAQIIGLFSVLLALGMGLTIPLFQFDLQKFVSSSLFIKIIMWVPIFTVFVGTLYANNLIRLAVLVTIAIAVSLEIFRVAQRQHKRWLYVYLLLFVVGFGHFYYLCINYQESFIHLLIILCFATVLSDVAAFFMGNYFGKHPLPRVLNNRKSWEGAAGQIIGAFIGIVLVDTFVFHVPTLLLFIPIGLGSVLGDLANSYTKRLVGIKDWGNSLPGHGGFLDRFSSFAGSVLLTFYYLMLFG